MCGENELVGRVPPFTGLEGSNDFSLPVPVLSDARRGTIGRAARVEASTFPGQGHCSGGGDLLYVFIRFQR